MIGLQQMEPIFTADLQPGGGSYDFGIINSSKYIGEVTYTPVLAKRPAYWDFEAGSYSIGGHNGGGPEQIGCSIMSTGISPWYLPESATKAFYGSVPSAYYDASSAAWGLHCNNTPPDFCVQLGGVDFMVPRAALVFAPLDKDGESCVCGILQVFDDGMIIFGDKFMKHFSFVFDMGK